MTTPEPDAAGSPSTDPDWRTLIAMRWQALVLEVFGIGTGPRRDLAEVGEESMSLLAVAAWFECHGNLTHAAARVGVSRRAYRDRLKAWRRLHPEFELPLPDIERRSHLRKAKTEIATTSPDAVMLLDSPSCT